ncbi:MAG: TldD/PmbA family protein, partial [Cyanobacteria bacterium P01_A01_bin.135]
MAPFEDAANLLSDRIARYRRQVDYLSIRLEFSESATIALRGHQTDILSESIAVGGQVRACHRGGWGFASFNRLSHLADYIEAAIAAARAVGTETTVLAPVDPVQASHRLPLTGQNPRHIPLIRKKALCDHYTDVLRSADDRITATSVYYNDQLQQVMLATSEGTLIEQAWTDMEIRFAATARSGDMVQTGRESIGSRGGYGDVEQLDSRAYSAARRAVDALSLSPVKGSSYTVVIDPVLTGLFVHEAFGHLSEADMSYESPDLLEVMALGRRFGPSGLQVFDGAALGGHRGSYYYDDEGVPATTTQLIEDGRLVGRLHSRETAGRLQEGPTGNARCLSYHYPPIVRMTNTWIARGDTPVQSML